MIDDASIDSRTVQWEGEDLPLREALKATLSLPATMDNLWRVAELYVGASPAMLESGAQWQVVLDALEASGFSPKERLHVLLRAGNGAYFDSARHVPGSQLVREALFEVDEDIVREVADDFLGMDDMPWGQQRSAALSVLALARHGVPDERYDELISLDIDWPDAQALLEALPEPRRQAQIVALVSNPSNRRNALYRIEKSLPFVELMDQSTRDLIAGMLDELAAGEPGDEEPSIDELRARLDGDFEPPEYEALGEDGLTESVRHALEYWAEKLDAQETGAAIGPLAESRRDLAIDVDAPELATLDAWRAASDERKKEIAHAVEEAAADYNLTFVELQTYAPDTTIAVFEHTPTGDAVSLVPGGTYTRGFSEREATVVQAHGEAHPEVENWYETFQFIIDQAPTMRPVAEVTVGPVLVFQEPSEPFEPADATLVLQEMNFRLLSEAEHEWVKRGGAESILGWWGDDFIDDDLYLDIFDPDVANAFGLRQIGPAPEVMTDVWVPNYEGAPTDGSARTGEGPRVVRGGADMLYPWQECGEWQLLTNAVRTPATDWEYFHPLRPALGVRCT